MRPRGKLDQPGTTQGVTHPGSGITFKAPQAWQVEVVGNEVLVALEPPRPHEESSRPPAFRANLVLTVGERSGLDFRAWQAATDHGLPALLDDYALIDLQRVVVGGLPGGRRLARHLSRNGDLLVMQQWCCLTSRLAITLTATTDLPSFAPLLPAMQKASSSLTLPRGSTAPISSRLPAQQR
ncbi:hypothetical protein BH23ACT6_BH23ACT6_11100 [soil metagenome]